MNYCRFFRLIRNKKAIQYIPYKNISSVSLDRNKIKMAHPIRNNDESIEMKHKTSHYKRDQNSSNEYDLSEEDEAWYPPIINKWLDFIKNEQDIGMQEFATPDLNPVGGVLKRLCSDFIVQEIDDNDKAVEFSKAESPDETASELLGPQDLNEGRKLLLKNMNELEVDNFICFLLSDQETYSFAQSKDIVNKNEIRLISLQHYRVNVKYKAKEDGQIEFEKGVEFDYNDTYSVLGKNEINWKRLGGDFCEFVLAKKDIDTMAACGLLNRQLKSSITYRGTKDKKAVTLQKIRAKDITAQQIYNITKDMSNIRASNFSYQKDPFRLSHSKGNQFTITLREVNSDDDSINSALNALKINGFINYFGIQRFGTTRLPTFSVGVEWLNGNFNGAVDIIIGGSTGERFSSARKTWFTSRDAKKTLNKFPHKSNIERTVLQYFVKKRNTSDCYSAIESLPPLTQSMYLHSYQSYVWNHMVSQRIKIYGVIPVIGDIVEVTKDEDKKDYIYLTNENLKEFNMTDVVMPMPGFDVKYPDNKMKEQYVEFMKKDGLDPFNMKRKQKRASLPGAYRKILGTVSNLTWEIKHYNDANDVLTADNVFDVSTKLDPNGKQKAVTVRMTLNSSVYATTALREVMRESLK